MQVFFVQFIIILDLALIFPICKYSILFCPANIFHLRSNKISSILQALSLHDFFIKFYKHINCRSCVHTVTGQPATSSLLICPSFTYFSEMKSGRKESRLLFFTSSHIWSGFPISRTGRISSDWDARISFSIFL